MSPVSSMATRQAGAPRARLARDPQGGVDTVPAGRIASFETDEFDAFNQSVAGWSVQYHALAATCHSAVLYAATPSLQLVHMQHTKGYSSQGANPAGTLSIVVPIDERLMVHRGHAIGPLEAGLTRSDRDYECVCRSGTRSVIVSVAREKLERCTVDLLHDHDLCEHAPDRLQFVDAVHRSRYIDTCLRVLGTVKDQPGVLEDRHAVALLEEKLLESLLLNARPSSPPRRELSRYTLARQAYSYLQDHSDEVPPIRVICAATGASYATLERGFRDTYGMTPKAMMLAMRLARAKQALLHPAPTTTVTSVALRWGFVEFGRFSAQYRQRYGEVPSETLRRARAGRR